MLSTSLVATPPTAASVSFADTATAFAYKTDDQLWRARLLFFALRYETLVRYGPALVRLALRFRAPVKPLIKKFFFEQFCGGVDLDDALKTAQRLHSFGVYSMLDYGKEAGGDEASFDQCANQILKSVRYAADKESLAFVALKISGLGKPDLLEKAAHTTLNRFEQAQYDRMRDRLAHICQTAESLGQPILIDAEESWTQDETDRLCEDMMMAHNRENPVVYTTVQLYRHDRLAYLKELYERMSAHNAMPGVKIVRGAYLEKENKRAKDMGYRTPMQPTKRHTDRDFDAAITFCLDRLQTLGLVVGAHNDDSNRLAAEYALNHGIAPNSPNLWFAQLYGMGDHLSFNLVSHGFNVAKYLPYGPLEDVLPYLFRRAEENSSIAGQTGRELGLVEAEIKRRRLGSRLKARMNRTTPLPPKP